MKIYYVLLLSMLLTPLYAVQTIDVENDTISCTGGSFDTNKICRCATGEKAPCKSNCDASGCIIDCSCNK